MIFLRVALFILIGLSFLLNMPVLGITWQLDLHPQKWL
jgi:hypothetical protein